MAGRVFIAQEVLRMGPDKKPVPNPNINLEPLLEFAPDRVDRRFFVLDWSDTRRPLNDPDALIWKARACLKRHDFDDDDYLCMVGDPNAMGVLWLAGSERADVLNVLTWNRVRDRYDCNVFNLLTQPR